MVFLFFWILCGWGGYAIAKKNGIEPFQGVLWGGFLGPLGLVVLCIMRGDPKLIEADSLKSGTTRKCPQCAELVRIEALKCKHCGETFAAVPPAKIEPAAVSGPAAASLP